MDVAHTHVCGIDVHKKSVSVCLLIGVFDTNRPKKLQKPFDTTVAGLKQLAEWLDDHEIELTVMESTGQYWRPVWTVLAQHSSTTLRLVNPQHIKSIPGRKTDIKDAQWIAELSRCGLIRPSYVPDIKTIELRESTRLKKRITQHQTVVKNEIHNILERSNIKLASFINDIFGVAGSKFIELLMNGEVVTMEKVQSIMSKRMKASSEEIYESLQGILSMNDRMLISIQYHLYEVYQEEIASLEAQIQHQMIVDQELHDRLMEIPGIGAGTAAVILAEIGNNVDSFESEMALASWTGLCPGSYESGGKTYGSRTTRGNPHIKSALAQSAITAKKCKDTYLSAWCYRLQSRTSKAKANIALAHKLLRIIYQMIKTGDHFDERKLKGWRFQRNHPA
ncbi:IS110 family transposase [Periweissella cryptocerci]|uniref:IS110 family transposase n=1 Tax=Periweissella cryptocerci TaxID=2506420 RepID=A0A4P6YVG8_9LACO|nr:IS110 family transposase [Periweissella cryptocerci]QBO36788.1 IS110 family transposase [Periweissella cryptocerci]